MTVLSCSMPLGDVERRPVADYVKLPEVARRLGVSEKTARRMVKSGKLPAVFIGGAYRVSEEDLAEYLEGATVDLSGKAPASSQPDFDGLLEEERRADRSADAARYVSEETPRFTDPHDHLDATCGRDPMPRRARGHR